MEPAVLLTVTMDMDGARSLNDRTPDFQRTGAYAYADASEAWEASLSRRPQSDDEAPIRYVAEVHFRDLSDDPAVWQRAVEGLLRVLVATVAPTADAVLLHGAALESPDSADGATVFLGASGAGKTTMTRRLPGWSRLSDDTVWVARERGTWVVRGTPFRGKEGLARDGRAAQLAQIVLLSPHAQDLRVEDVGAGEGYFALLQRLLWFSSDPLATDVATAALAELAAHVPMTRLHSNLGHDLSQVFPTSPAHVSPAARVASC